MFKFIFVVEIQCQRFFVSESFHGQKKEINNRQGQTHGNLSRKIFCKM